MRILVSNDDGYDAPGIRALADAASALGEVYVVAPVHEQSAQSHSLTLRQPLRARPRGDRAWEVSGTPADCIYMAFHGLLDGPPDLVLSGVNRGSNLGGDVHYSGTVAAAREASFQGIPSVAVSLHILDEHRDRHYETATGVAMDVARFVLEHGLPAHTLLNVNVPNIPPEALLGIRTATLGNRNYDHKVARREDPWGLPYYWIGGSHVAFDDIPGSDGPLVESGYASVTPLHSDPTLHTFLDELRERIDS